MVLKIKSSEWWKSATIIIGLLIFAIVGYYIIRPSTCENAGNCGSDAAEYFTGTGNGGRDYSLDIKNQWNNLLKTATGTNFLVEMPNPANAKYVINQVRPNVKKAQNYGVGADAPSNPNDETTSINFPINPIRNAYFQIDLSLRNDAPYSNVSENNWSNVVQVIQYRGPDNSNIYIPNMKIYSNTRNINNDTWYELQLIFKMPDDVETTESPFYLCIMIPSGATFQRFVVQNIQPIQNIYQSYPEYNNLIMYLDSRIPESYNGNGAIWRDLIMKNKMFQLLTWSGRPYWSNEAFHFGTSKIKLMGRPSTFITNGKKPEEVEFTLVWNYQQNEESNNLSQKNEYAPFITFYGNQNIALEVQIPVSPFYPIKVICGDKYYIADISYDSTQMNNYTLTYKNKQLKIWIQNRLCFDKEVRIPYMNSRQFEINSKYRLNGIMQYLLAYDIQLLATQVGVLMNSVQSYPSLYHELQSGKSVLNIFAPKQLEEPMTSRAPSAIKCPKILFDKNTAEYEIYIDQQNPYDQNAGKVGTYFSSPNKQEVLQKYLKNFVGCPVPDTLVSRPTTVNCPFRQNRGSNPCYQRECFNMNWNSDELNPGELMTPACGQNINKYCSSNYKKEPICNCWDPRYQQTPQCRKMRGLITGKVPKMPKVRSLYPVDENPEYPLWMKK